MTRNTIKLLKIAWIVIPSASLVLGALIHGRLDGPLLSGSVAVFGVLLTLTAVARKRIDTRIAVLAPELAARQLEMKALNTPDPNRSEADGHRLFLQICALGQRCGEIRREMNTLADM